MTELKKSPGLQNPLLAWNDKLMTEINLKQCVTQLLNITPDTTFANVNFRDRISMGVSVDAKMIDCQGHYVLVEKNNSIGSKFIQASIIGGINDDIGLSPRPELGGKGNINYNQNIRLGSHNGFSVSTVKLKKKTLIIISASQDS